MISIKRDWRLGLGSCGAIFAMFLDPPPVLPVFFGFDFVIVIPCSSIKWMAYLVLLQNRHRTPFRRFASEFRNGALRSSRLCSPSTDAGHADHY